MTGKKEGRLGPKGAPATAVAREYTIINSGPPGKNLLNLDAWVTTVPL